MDHGFRLDHVVILVPDLERAIRDYSSLGFVVTPGGKHAGGASRNALIPFEDESYLELIAFDFPPSNEQGSPLDSRFLRRGADHSGLVDFALLPPTIERDVALARARGASMTGPLPGGRVRPDGQSVAWQLAVPATHDLPFLCADVTRRHLRVPTGSARRHPNRVLGVAGMGVAVHDLAESTSRYRALLGTEPRWVTARLGDSAGTPAFPLGSTMLTLLAPAETDDSVARELAQRGEGLFRLQLRTSADAPQARLDPAHTHGARIELFPEDTATPTRDVTWNRDVPT